jgi:hypothetical protein
MEQTKSMDHLETSIVAAHGEGMKFVGILVEMDEFPEKELIINKYANFIEKLNYYKNTYDENLQHKYAKNIRISGVCFGNSLAEIENRCYGIG